MKKILRQVTVIVIMSMAMLIFTSCENASEEMAIQDSDEQLTKEDFLNDFDYMMETMEDTFPYFGVAERRLGVDIRALGRDTRAMIENYPHSLEGLANEVGISLEDMPELDEHIFWSIIRHEFFSHFLGFAHTYPLDSGLYNRFQFPYSSPSSPLFTSHNHYAFTNPVTQRFYQEQEALYHTLAEEEGTLFQLVFRGYPPVQLPHSIVKTEIIEEDKIAYLKVPSFLSFNLNTIHTLSTFYRNIQQYEHLIIDIRDNPGGSPDIWRMYIMKPLWWDRNNMPDMPLYAFYRGSKLGKSLGEVNLKMEAQNSRNIPGTDNLLTISEIMEVNDLPHFNEEDVQDLAYGVRFNTSISNIEWRHMHHLGFQNIADYPFEGELWLLTNENNGSGSALFARHAKEMGFATLVGAQTGGSYTTSSGWFFALPNTGIIVRWDIDYLTDHYGRALNEFPTTPHHFNRPGMDALETVLQLIEEGSF